MSSLTAEGERHRSALSFKVTHSEIVFSAISVRIFDADSSYYKAKNYLDADFFPSTREFVIRMIRSSKPRQGIGKILLRKALEEANKVHAYSLTATIVSRELISDAQDVFGENSVSIKRLGEFGRHNSANASLNVSLQTTEAS